MGATCRALLVCFLTAHLVANAFEPITTTLAVGVTAALGRTIYNYFHESCDPKWVQLNATGENGAGFTVQINPYYRVNGGLCCGTTTCRGWPCGTTTITRACTPSKPI